MYSINKNILEEIEAELYYLNSFQYWEPHQYAVFFEVVQKRMSSIKSILLEEGIKCASHNSEAFIKAVLLLYKYERTKEKFFN